MKQDVESAGCQQAINGICAAGCTTPPTKKYVCTQSMGGVVFNAWCTDEPCVFPTETLSQSDVIVRNPYTGCQLSIGGVCAQNCTTPPTKRNTCLYVDADKTIAYCSDQPCQYNTIQKSNVGMVVGFSVAIALLVVAIVAILIVSRKQKGNRMDIAEQDLLVQ